MLKLIGAVLILCASISGGYIPMMQLKQRIRLLEQLERDLGRMSAELHTNLMPIPELLERIAGECGQMTKSIYAAVLQAISESGPASISDAWANAVAKCCVPLSEEERSRLCDLGMSLGMYALEDELAMFEDTSAFLRSAVEDAKTGYAEKCKVSVSLAASLGLFFIIALV